jgi:hypothetical protein
MVVLGAICAPACQKRSKHPANDNIMNSINPFLR